MSVYFIASIRFGDPNLRGAYDQYIAKVKPVVESLGGTYLARSEQVEGLFATDAPDRVILIRFADRESLRKCFKSEAYRAIAPLREQAVHAEAIVVDAQSMS